jgi:hypothetical protein
VVRSPCGSPLGRIAARLRLFPHEWLCLAASLFAPGKKGEEAVDVRNIASRFFIGAGSPSDKRLELRLSHPDLLFAHNDTCAFTYVTQAAGLATMISTMRPDIDNADEYVRNTTARAFAVIASALGIPVRARWFGSPSPQRNLRPLFRHDSGRFCPPFLFPLACVFGVTLSVLAWLTRADLPQKH